MTLNEISRKLIRNNTKNYALFFFSVLFSFAVIGAYGVLQYSKTVTNVLIDGGSTQTISKGMFFGSMIGILIFLVYADCLFLRYKSREIGIYLSLGINRKNVQKMIAKEFSAIFTVAIICETILVVPIAFGCWSLLSLFIHTQETQFYIGWFGFIIMLLYAVICYIILSFINARYIRTVDIMKILKTTEETEKAVQGSLFLLILGCILTPGGIAAFFILQNMGGLLYTVLAFLGIVIAIIGTYLLILQLASIGDIISRINKKVYYKNIVFFNLLKQKIKQYTRSIFVASILILFTVFGIGFIAAGFIDGYNTAINEPFDYTVYTTCDKTGISEDRIRELARENAVEIEKLTELNCCLLGVENHYKDGDSDWGSRVILSDTAFNHITGQNIKVSQGSFTLYYDTSMSYKANAFCEESTMFYNPSTKEEFKLIKNEPISADGLFNSRSFFSSFLILQEDDYNKIVKTLDDQYEVNAYFLNVVNWEETASFQDSILQAVVESQGEEIFTNWHNSATFEKLDGKPDYLSFNGNESRIARVWTLYPLSKLSSATTQFEAFATYLMLMLFIAIVVFLSAIMIICIKIFSTIWDDAAVYENLKRLGMRQKEIRRLITGQILFVYFIPTILGCLLGAFTTYRILLVSGVIYIGKTMELVGGVCGFVVLLQSIIFLILRHRIMK